MTRGKNLIMRSLHIYSATGSQPIEKQKNLMSILTILTIKILWVTIHVKGVHKMHSRIQKVIITATYRCWKNTNLNLVRTILPVAFGTFSVRHQEWH
jgi:hypothetical protein